ncbi:MAG: RHS repeat protein, partial [Solirubrobacterales bacterium]|nr:RHS repeat protein [Solirubrobacterales bacterium]
MATLEREAAGKQHLNSARFLRRAASNHRGSRMPAALVRRFARSFLTAIFLLPLMVSGLSEHVVSGQEARAAAAPVGAAPVPSPAGMGPELVELRSRSSRSFAALDGGAYRTLVSQSSLNYRVEDGSWRPIDNKLVPAASGGGYVNGANSLRFRLPENLSQPVRVENGTDWASFSLTGASATATAQVSGSKATYRNVLPGVGLTFEARSDFLKESIVLAGPAAASTLMFRIKHSDGLSARKDPNGAIEFVDSKGERRLGFAPPFMFDASGERTGFSRAASFSLAKVGDVTELTLTANRAWLTDPERRFPVTIDPTTGGPYGDCTLTSGSGATTSYCAAQTLQVGNDGRNSRVLSPWDLSSIPAQATITQAELRMYLQSASAGTAGGVSLHRQTRTHGSNATWSSYDGTNAWTAAGGDFVSTAEDTNAAVGPVAGIYSWYPTKLLIGWHNGTIPNNGMLLKATDEAASNLLTFTSYDAAANEPALWVWWTPQWGRHGYYKFEEQGLAERLGVAVNVANGNALVSANDISVAGLGLDLELTRTFNTLDSNTRRFGRGTSWIAGLVIQQDGGVVYYGDSGEKTHFVRNADGSYQRPMGFDATLVKNADGTFTLTDHGSSLKEQFSAVGRLTSIVDTNANQVSFAYNTSGYPNQITDTRGRTWTLRYNAQNLIDQITESASTRTWAYAYDTNGNLTSYTDPASGTTQYQYYATDFRLFQITSPGGQKTILVYDTAGRVVSVRRETSTGVGPLTQFAYNSGNTVVTDPNNKATTHNYDSSLRPTSTVDPLGNTTSATYTANSNVATYTGGTSSVTQNGHDANFNVTSATLPTGASASWQYSNATHKYLPTQATDEQGNATSMVYDSKTNLSSLTNAASSQATYTYNTNGTVATAYDFKSNLTSFTYNASGALTGVDNPAPLGDLSYTYDSLSRVATTTDGKAQTTTFAYDSLDRVTSITYSGGSVITYVYDANGNVTSKSDNTGGTSYGYDSLNRLTQETGPSPKSLTYGYDAAGNLTSFYDGEVNATVTYAYNGANLLTTLTEPNGLSQTTFSYDADQMRTQINYPNGVSMFFTYDQSNRLTRVLGKEPASGTVLTDFVYSWTNASGQDRGVRQSVTDKDGSKTSYTYDSLNRLTLAQERSSTNVLLNSYAYSYD